MVAHRAARGRAAAKVSHARLSPFQRGMIYMGNLVAVIALAGILRGQPSSKLTLKTVRKNRTVYDETLGGGTMSVRSLLAPPLQCRSSSNFRVVPGQTTFALAPTLKGRRIDIEGRADIDGACPPFLKLILTRIGRAECLRGQCLLRGCAAWPSVTYPCI